jgi:hypothetical protein
MISVLRAVLTFHGSNWHSVTRQFLGQADQLSDRRRQR